MNEEFDSANEAVDIVKEEFDVYLKKVREMFKDKRINFSHAKYRYELEIPEDLVKGGKKPTNFEFTS